MCLCECKCLEMLRDGVSYFEIRVIGSGVFFGFGVWYLVFFKSRKYFW